MRRALVAASLFLLLLSPLASAKEMGTDPAGDDAAGLTITPDPSGFVGGFLVPCPLGDDCADMDDILSLSATNTADRVDFKLVLAALPDDATLAQSQYCWLAGFQVEGKEEEFLAVGCTDYTLGMGMASTIDSSRGTEVGTFEWVAGEAAVLINVPFADIGASLGTVLVDVYGLTYLEGYVSDAAPDAKSDRNAAESFGSYTLVAAAPESNTTQSTTDNATSSSTSATSSTSSTTTTTSSATTSTSRTFTSDEVTTSTSSSSSSSTAAAGDGKDSPSLALPALLAAVALALLVRRRLA